MSILNLIAAGPANSSAILSAGCLPLTFGALSVQAEKVARFLNLHRIGRADCVAMVLPNGPELAAAFTGVAAAAVCAPLNPAYSASEFHFYLSDLRACALLTEAGFCPAATRAAIDLGIPILSLRCRDQALAGVFELESSAPSGPAAHPGMAGKDDVALLLHSSGTTARPKLIPLTHHNLCTSARHIVECLRLTPSDRCLNIMPLFHVHGLIGAFLASMAAGASIWCTSGFNAHQFFRCLTEARPTWFTAVPSMHQAILCRMGARRQDSEPRLRFVRSSSAALPVRTWKELEARFECPAIEAYGMTEAAHQITSNPLPPAQRQAGSVGTATGTSVVILDEAGAVQPAGVRGEVAIRGESVTSGYCSPPEANATALHNGWLRTGDQGFIDGKGYVTLTGRLKEIINCGGEKISPAEVDEVLSDHPSVATALAFGVECPMSGERVYAAVVPREGAAITEHELKEFASVRLARFKIPRRILILDEIPKGPTGKMQRIGMAQRLGVSVNGSSPDA
ncbi:MAG TPA: AMP-binding protein [Terriglobales bacterium]|nr:AMP-binding protein [Terriglobales bacterium]